jgi:hypothetical protein
MQFDRTQIVIRQRDLWEVVDLALVVVRHLFRPLLAATALIMLPIFVVNWILLWPLISQEQNGEYAFRFALAMACLTVIQAPLASLSGVLYLGRVTFHESMTLSRLARELAELSPRLAWGIGLMRLVFPAWVVAAFIDPSESFSAAENWLIFVTMGAWLIRAINPYIAEVIVLERNPYFGGQQRRMTVGRRLRLLRSSGGSEAISRLITMAIPALLVTLAMAGTFWFALRITLGTNRLDMIGFALALTLSLAAISMFLMVVDFLSYLDLRIRREGWEIELQLRAAAASLTEGSA